VSYCCFDCAYFFHCSFGLRIQIEWFHSLFIADQGRCSPGFFLILLESRSLLLREVVILLIVLHLMISYLSHRPAWRSIYLSAVHLGRGELLVWNLVVFSSHW